MSADPASGLRALAGAAPLAYAATTAALAVAAALAVEPGPRRAATIAAIFSLALTLGAPAWGWAAGLASVVVLAIASGAPRHRPRAAACVEHHGSALLLGRTARLGGGRAAARVRLDGRAWRARLEGVGGPADARVRVVRVERDGRLVVRLASG